MKNREKFYISTPIYYPSGKWHIGTCYTTVICDCIARYNRLQGKEVFYLTGTDEHGQKLQNVAEQNGMDTKLYIDKNVEKLKKLWEILDISYDKFIRTTDEYHKKAVQKIFEKLHEKGFIYEKKYEGWYCTPCESFFTDNQLKDGKCPDCNREVKKTEEDSYFFKLSAFQQKIEKLFNRGDFLLPESRKREMLNNFIKPGLQDICVSRTSFDWGIKVPFNKKHVVYVWIDALTNYITALGYMSKDDSLFQKFWPCDIHMMAKEIVRFHSIIWPAILMALDIDPPKKIYAHGWLLFGDEKISKSKMTSVVDPFILADRYSSSAVRSYLLREIQFGQDGNFTNELFLNRYNADLANTLGNLVSRSIAMCEKYFGGVVPLPSKNNYTGSDSDLINSVSKLSQLVKDNVEKMDISKCLDGIWDTLHTANKYIDITAPWILAKDEKNKERLKVVIYNLLETIRICAINLEAFLPEVSQKIYEKLSIQDKKEREYETAFSFGELKERKVKKGNSLFERVDVQKELEELNKISSQEKEEDNLVKLNEIEFSDFEKVKLKVAKVTQAEPIKKSNKLLKLQVKIGNEARQIVSGIAKYYKSEDLIGKSIVIVCNLKPVKLCGEISQGMILCASNSETLKLITVDGDISSGSEVY